MKLEDWKKLWIPDFIMQNTEYSEHTSTNTDEEHSKVRLSYLNESQFTTRYSNNYNDFYYGGSNVLITKSNSYTYHFICDFDWSNYPFDRQVGNSTHFHLYQLNFKLHEIKILLVCIDANFYCLLEVKMPKLLNCYQTSEH